MFESLNIVHTKSYQVPNLEVRGQINNECNISSILFTYSQGFRDKTIIYKNILIKDVL